MNFVHALQIFAVSLSAYSTEPVASSQPAHTAETVLIYGSYSYGAHQRIVSDNGLTALIQDQQIGQIPLVFKAQRTRILRRESECQDARDYDCHNRFELDNPRTFLNPEDHQLIFVRGRFVTETHRVASYANNRKEFIEYKQKRVAYFLAENDYQACGKLSIACSDEDCNAITLSLPASTFAEDVADVSVTLGDPPHQISAKTVIRSKRANRVLVNWSHNRRKQLEGTFQILKISNVPPIHSLDPTTLPEQSGDMPLRIISISKFVELP